LVALKVKSKALEVNLADYHVEVAVDAKYAALQDTMAKYYGLTEGLNIFLKELSHPYRNWRFIVVEARRYSLEYYHLIRNHSRGAEAARLLMDIFLEVIESAEQPEVQSEAVDNLLLFVQKIVKESGDAIEAFLPVTHDTFNRIYGFSDDLFLMFVRSYYGINRLTAACREATSGVQCDFSAVNRLLLKYLLHTYDYWLREEDPWRWFEKEAKEFDAPDNFNEYFLFISHGQFQKWRQQAEQSVLNNPIDSREVLDRLLELPGFGQIVDTYRQMPRQLLQTGDQNGRSRYLKLIFLFHIMNIAGLSLIHEETLRDINKTLAWIIENENYRNIENLIRKTFAILKEQTRTYPATALNCVLNMGKGVYKTDEIDLVNFFIDSVIDLGFQAPMLQGVDNDWKIKVNSTHILNIRTWLEVIEVNPKWSTRLLSGVIIHLSLCGVFIKDIDLFPRDITRFLNSGITPVYNLAKQLTRLFPAFFNDIGAEGRLREISTQVDEITHRRDKLIHFLRKQSHVESSNRIVPFMEATLRFWKTRDKTGLKPFVPPIIYDEIETRGPFIDGVHRLMVHLEKTGFKTPADLLTVSETDIQNLLEAVTDIADVERQRVTLAVVF
jgi:pyruvate,orthophosphate dikinase